MGNRVRLREDELTQLTLRHHAHTFKAEVALEVAREEDAITESSDEYGLHTIRSRAWKEQPPLTSGAAGPFALGSR